MAKQHLYTNRLINETSPYLLQHAHNPVNWYPWGPEALQKAKDENKMLLISIGYSACHWCHVMERECFEDPEVAAVMNEHYINIKVDREERPDIDQVYMSAVQLMTQRGGWPLNCIALPDGRPIYGGTYFPKHHWLNVLEQVNEVFVKDNNKAVEYAIELTRGVALSGLIEKNTEQDSLTTTLLHQMVANWQQQFDNIEGGPNRAPKFPLPNNYLFLLRYGVLTSNKTIQDHVNLTLTKMAYGGIYDQLGGGFARYSVDGLWKVPHFEKMLYDNAQLISLYAEAYKATGNKLYKNIVDETIAFIERELTSSEGLFTSALDADSEGEEGLFYIWKKDELKTLLTQEEFKLTEVYYNINFNGLWEEGNYILLRTQSVEEVAQTLQMPMSEIEATLVIIKAKLMEARNQRIRPGLDDKCLASWNAMMIKAYADAYKFLGNDEYRKKAFEAIDVFEQAFILPDGQMMHSFKNGKATINGFLEDYCFAIESFISLFEITHYEGFITKAEKLVAKCYELFEDTISGMFFFTPYTQTDLIARKLELFDNVIPASNSSLARSLFILGKLTGNIRYAQSAKQMLNNIAPQMEGYGAGHSNWGLLALQTLLPFYEVVIMGDNANEFIDKLTIAYLPQASIIKGNENSVLPIFSDRYVNGKTLAYVCQGSSCLLPTEDVTETLALLTTNPA